MNKTSNKRIKKTLENCILENKFKYFNKSEIFQLIQSILILINHYIYEHPLCFMNPLQHDSLYSYIFELLKVQFENLFLESDLNIELNNIIDISFSLFYKYIIPKRSYKKTFIRIRPNRKIINKKLYYLQNKEQAAQRTDEWYQFRHNILTASNLWKVFGSQATQNQLIYEKCKPYTTNRFNISLNSPLHWGQKYEPVSILYYEMINNTLIKDFGCIKHNKYNFLAASPDGINSLEKSPLFGRMLEVKNIVNRVINGIPKLEYWIQMQIQMETCNLNECDFLETKFIEYEDKEAYDVDGSYNLSLDNCCKGIIILFIKDELPHYEYMPLNLTKEEAIKWEFDIMNKNDNLTWIKNIYWKLEKVSCILVLRNKFWFSQALPEIENIWNIICKEKITGYEHRAPKKRLKKLIVQKCYVDTSLI